MLLELELLLQREGRDGSFDAAASLNNSGHFADGYAVRKRRSRATEPVHRHHLAGHDKFDEQVFARRMAREQPMGHVRQRLTFRRSGAAMPTGGKLAKLLYRKLPLSSGGKRR
jgi:hypothetical protein